MNPNSLPIRPEELRGLRAGGWIRESTAGQADKYGPRAQHRMHDAAIAEFDLVDTGLRWTVLKSGWSGVDSMKEPPATQTPDFRAMVSAVERGSLDVLLVGYTSRFLRDLTLALHYRRYFMSHGVVIWICDDRILTSNPADWERLVDKLKAAEVYSRDHSRNIRAGYLAKRVDEGDPGGHAPLGFRRVNDLLEVDEPLMAVVKRIYELGAAGRTDHEIVDLTGRTLHTIRHVLKNAIYIGRLQDGSPFRLGASIDIGTWNDVQAHREKRRTREPGRVVTRTYALKVKCSKCQLYLHGDMERYRHPLPVCDAFAAAKPVVPPVRGRHNTSEGKSFRQDWYEAIPGRLLAEISATPQVLVEAVLASLRAEPAIRPNELALARIARQVDEASQKLAKTRDIGEWQANMARLDAEKEAVLASAAHPDAEDPAQATDFLRDLGSLWARSDPRIRQEVALALWDSWQFLGFTSATYRWSAHALRYGLDRLVPAEITFDLRELGLHGSPSGTFTLRAATPKSTLTTVSAVAEAG